MAAPIIAVARLSRQAGLAVYDAACFWLAMELDAPLITLDRNLAVRAERAGGRALVWQV